MLQNLLLGLPTMIVCLLLQALIFAAAIPYYRRYQNSVSQMSFLATVTILVVVLMFLLIGIVAQLAVWAALFLALGEFESFAEAVYHSAVNFATLGYGDFVMSDQHKFLGPLEAVNGVLMIGVSTAALTSAFQDAIRKSQRLRMDSGDQGDTRDYP